MRIHPLFKPGHVKGLDPSYTALPLRPNRTGLRPKQQLQNQIHSSHPSYCSSSLRHQTIKKSMSHFDVLSSRNLASTTLFSPLTSFLTVHERKLVFLQVAKVTVRLHHHVCSTSSRMQHRCIGPTLRLKKDEKVLWQHGNEIRGRYHNFQAAFMSGGGGNYDGENQASSWGKVVVSPVLAFSIRSAKFTTGSRRLPINTRYSDAERTTLWQSCRLLLLCRSSAIVSLTTRHMKPIAHIK